jgi:hypothetical protein
MFSEVSPARRNTDHPISNRSKVRIDVWGPSQRGFGWQTRDGAFDMFYEMRAYFGRQKRLL